MNIGHGPLADHARGDIRACLAEACNQGRKPCPCPDACRLPTDDGLGVFRGLVWALGLTLGAATLAYICALVWPWLR